GIYGEPVWRPCDGDSTPRFAICADLRHTAPLPALDNQPVSVRQGNRSLGQAQSSGKNIAHVNLSCLPSDFRRLPNRDQEFKFSVRRILLGPFSQRGMGATECFFRLLAVPLGVVIVTGCELLLGYFQQRCPPSPSSPTTESPTAGRSPSDESQPS